MEGWEGEEGGPPPPPPPPPPLLYLRYGAKSKVGARLSGLTHLAEPEVSQGVHSASEF